MYGIGHEDLGTVLYDHLAEPFRRLYEVNDAHYTEGLQDRMPPGGTEESSIPYVVRAVKLAEEVGIRALVMGGTPKQALRDEKSIINPTTGQVIVPGQSQTFEKATLYRPDEYTIRDVDLKAEEMLIDGVWVPALPKYRKELKRRQGLIQAGLNAFAQDRGFPRGLEVSLFGYETPQRKFRPWHYTTRTEYAGNREILSHSIGVEHEFDNTERWLTVIETEEGIANIPTASPSRVLGRTLTRSVILRRRDNADVDAGVRKITVDSLDDVVLAVEWRKYVALRNGIDQRFTEEHAAELHESGHLTDAAMLRTALKLAPLAGPIEEKLSARIRDPHNIIGKLSALAMGAQTSKKKASKIKSM